MHESKANSILSNRNQFAVILVWLVGLLFGGILARDSETYMLLLYNSCNTRASLLNLLLHCFAPLLISLLAIRWNKPLLILAVCFVKALLLGLCGRLLIDCFHQSSWVVLPMLFFSDIIIAPAMLCFWLNSINATTITSYTIIPYLLVAGLTVCIDYCYISPFLMMIFKNL